MERLRDSRPTSDPDLAKASELIAGIPPIEPTNAFAARLRARIDASPIAPVGLWTRAVLGGCVVAGVALAAVGARHLRSKSPEVPRPAATTRATPVAAPSVVVRPIAEAPAFVPMATTSPRGVSAPSAAAPTASKPAHAPKHREASAGGFDLDAPDAQLVVSAVQALRQENKPAQAEVLLAEYLHRHPTGALEEEALALRIEAGARQSDPRAADYATAYLQAFPSGRYAEAARRAKARFGK